MVKVVAEVVDVEGEDVAEVDVEGEDAADVHDGERADVRRLR